MLGGQPKSNRFHNKTDVREGRLLSYVDYTNKVIIIITIWVGSVQLNIIIWMIIF